MIITRTPFRISFAGGGSDIKNYYEFYGGCVVSVAITKYMYLSMHPYFDENGYLLKYSQSENVANLQDIKHRIIKAVFKRYNIKGVDFNSSADIPSGTGLASSSAFTSGLINLCNAYTNKCMTKDEIANLACEIEINDLKSPIGKQDQYACTFGGLNYIKFNMDDTVNIIPILISEDNLKTIEKNLLLFYTGKTRFAENILKEQNLNIKNDIKKVKNLQKMVELANNLKKELSNGNIRGMGEILHAGWKYKKELANGITNPDIDNAYEMAINNGALGGKLLGAGGGGFLLFYAEEKNHNKIIKALSHLKQISFNFDYEGTKIIYHNEAR